MKLERREVERETAMEAVGTDVALETADVALMAYDLEKVAYALRLARRSRSVVSRNLALSSIVMGSIDYRRRLMDRLTLAEGSAPQAAWR